MPDPRELADLAVEAARAAGRLLLDARHRVRTSVETKSSGTDMVTEMDRDSEDLVAGVILAARPSDVFVGEEASGAAGAEAGGPLESPAGPPGGEGGRVEGVVRWVVDPLDGTTNYLYGFPWWAVSIAAEVDGAVVAGVVHDPTRDEMYTAVRGQGASCNGVQLRVDGAPDLPTALVGTGFSYDAAARGRQARELARILPAVRDVRRAGAAALDLCAVAAGRLDAFYERALQPWDWAAGALVAAEAGAVVALLADGTLVAAAPRLHQPLLALLARAREETSR